MAEFAKKLTVTFGAFSCTLAGFENPFPIMREVVDYFQALADRDPAFGAHPERPDTEKLRSLAETATGEFVDAEMRGDEVVLSSTDIVSDSTESKATEIAPEPDLANTPQPEPQDEFADPFEHVEPEHLDTEIFENLTSDDLYDTLDEAEPIEPERPDEEAQRQAAYISQDVVFEDIDADEQVEPDEVAQDIIDTLSPKEDPQVWAAELNSDAPIETIEQPDNIVAHQSDDDPQPEAELELQAEIESQLETAEQANDEFLAMLLEAAATEQAAPEAPATHAPQIRPVKLGFGDDPGLDATRMVKTSTRDERTSVQPQIDSTALGIFEEEDAEFGWNSPEAAAPKSASPEPFVLTPDQMIVPETPAAALPSVTMMQQEDPRDDLRAFAKSVDAGSLPELLEASAAFTTIIRGRPSFSRREILGMLDEFSDETSISQEARIKTFGALLRGGRIKRGENGDYEMTSNALSAYERRKAS